LCIIAFPLTVVAATACFFKTEPLLLKTCHAQLLSSESLLFNGIFSQLEPQVRLSWAGKCCAAEEVNPVAQHLVRMRIEQHLILTFTESVKNKIHNTAKQASDDADYKNFFSLCLDTHK
jgi:hypothetical protein